MPETIGWSPKVAIPGLIQLGVGVALVLLGVLVVGEPMATIGYTALGTGVLTLGIGHAASPGVVQLPETTDDLENDPLPLDHVKSKDERRDLHDAEGA